MVKLKIKSKEMIDIYDRRWGDGFREACIENFKSFTVDIGIWFLINNYYFLKCTYRLYIFFGVCDIFYNFFNDYLFRLFRF